AIPPARPWPAATACRGIPILGHDDGRWTQVAFVYLYVSTKPTLEALKVTMSLDFEGMLQVALAEARAGLNEGGIPIGAALFDGEGHILGRGHNRRVQDDDPSAHAETDAFRNAGRRTDYSECVLVSTLAPCWYCSGLV